MSDTQSTPKMMIESREGAQTLEALADIINRTLLGREVVYSLYVTGNELVGHITARGEASDETFASRAHQSICIPIPGYGGIWLRNTPIESRGKSHYPYVEVDGEHVRIREPYILDKDGMTWRYHELTTNNPR